MDFADVKNDIAFRKIFGNEQKPAPLISFINAALQLEGDHRVVSVFLHFDFKAVIKTVKEIQLFNNLFNPNL